MQVSYHVCSSATHSAAVPVLPLLCLLLHLLRHPPKQQMMQPLFSLPLRLYGLIVTIDCTSISCCNSLPLLDTSFVRTWLSGFPAVISACTCLLALSQASTCTLHSDAICGDINFSPTTNLDALRRVACAAHDYHRLYWGQGGGHVSCGADRGGCYEAQVGPVLSGLVGTSLVWSDMLVS